MSALIVAPSILAAEFGSLTTEIQTVARAKWLHLDVMDGNFVPPITFGARVLSLAKTHSKQFLDVHLMVANPQDKFKEFADCGADLLSFHYEATKDPGSCIRAVQSLGLACGLAIKPDTQISQPILNLLPELDLILVMTVEPGWGGQKFMPAMLEKVSALAAEISAKQLPCKIEVDGGINEVTGSLCAKAGANVLVAGSYIFSVADRSAQIGKLEQL